MSEEAKTEEPKPEEKTTDERDDLEQFLNEFQDARKPEPAAVSPTGDNRYKAFLERKMVEEEEQETVRTVQSYASLIKEASGSEVDVEAIEGALLRRNLVDKEFRNVVSKHQERPEEVRRYMKLIAEDIVKPFAPKIDPVVTDSKESVRAAAKTNKPEPVEDKFPSDDEVWAMSRKEFAQLQKDVQTGKR